MTKTRLDTMVRFEPEERDRIRKVLTRAMNLKRGDVLILSAPEADAVSWFLGELRKE